MVTRAGHVVVGAGKGSRIKLSPGAPARMTLGRTTYRALSTQALANADGIGFAVLTPQHEIDSSVDATETRLAAVLATSLVLIGIVTYLLGRSIVRTLRDFVGATNAIVEGRLDVRVTHRGNDEFGQLATAFNRMAAQLEQRLAEVAIERRRVQEVATGFAQALAATHDEISLLRVVAESAMQATAGTAALVTRGGTEIVRIGDPDTAAQHLLLPLRAASSDYGSLTIYGNDFETEGVEIAAVLARQAVFALENARLHHVVEQQALMDELTGVGNRRFLDETLRTELLAAAHSGKRFALVLADLDHFKRVNDRYGHPFGDGVLVSFANVLKDAIRTQDFAGRWGGEEFALVLTDTDAHGATRLAERVRLTTETLEMTSDSGERVSITASFGVASYPAWGSVEELVAAADEALYAAKHAGRNRVVCATEPSADVDSTAAPI